MKHSLLAVVILAAAMPLLILGQTSPAGMTKFLGLFDQLRAAETAKVGGAAPHVAFRLNEGEINNYLKYSWKAMPGPGLDSDTVKLSLITTSRRSRLSILMPSSAGSPARFPRCCVRC